MRYTQSQRPFRGEAGERRRRSDTFITEISKCKLGELQQLGGVNNQPGSHRSRLPDKELVIDLVHGGKVAHICQEDVDLNDVLQTAPRSVEDGGKVLQRLALVSSGSVRGRRRIRISSTPWQGKVTTHRPIFDITFNELGRVWVNAEGS